MILVLLWSALAALTFGSIPLNIVQVYHIVINEFFTNKEFVFGNIEPVHDIVWLMRMPRVVLAMTVGGALAVSGVVMQAVVV